MDESECLIIRDMFNKTEWTEYGWSENVEN
jgi:hypothetical protein